ncbi:YrhK family protein [Kaustia mangrovi]|uniref:YrhK family protein n=1 Tax=Kaustia mangrovi TaxID=2593653 RepID=UPI001BCBFC1D|nr:YrhK family protein [Kaustia mangrovi]
MGDAERRALQARRGGVHRRKHHVLPRFEAYANLGAWLFFFGSLLYLVVTGHDMVEVRRFWKRNRRHTPGEKLEYTAASSYLGGTILFTAGSLFFLSWWGWLMLGSWCFVIGSALFVVGASVNVLQIVRARSLITMQLMNLTAVTFVVGSTLFVVASVPYLWTIESAGDHYVLFSFIAWQYLAGSILFFMGGVFNYYRAYIVMRGQLHVARAH